MIKSFASVWILGAVIAAAIIIMSVIYILKAVKRAKAINMDMRIIKETVKNSAIFSIVPSIPIVIGVGIMMAFLGAAIPWIRLTVIGSLQYEMTAMFQIFSVSDGSQEAKIAAAVVIMTLSIIGGPLFNIIFYKRYQNKLAEIREKNSKKMDTITGALLTGMLSGIICAILFNSIFTIGSPATDKATGLITFGEITLITTFASIIIMAICGLLLIKFKQKWIESYALPLSILGSMAIAYAFTFVF